MARITVDPRLNQPMKHSMKVRFSLSIFISIKLMSSLFFLVYEYLTKSIHPQKNETLRRGMSMAVAQHEKPAPPVRRTPSMSTNTQMSMNIRFKPTQETIQSNPVDDFPPPPPDFLLSNEPKPTEPLPPPATDPHSSLLAEIQRGGFKLRKTVIDHDRSAPRIK